MKNSLRILFLFLIVVMMSGWTDLGFKESGWNEYFGKILSKVSIALKKASGSQPFHSPKMNASLQKTSQALEQWSASSLMSQGDRGQDTLRDMMSSSVPLLKPAGHFREKDSRRAVFESLLQQALKDYPENRIVYYLQGLAASSRGDQRGVRKAFQTFLSEGKQRGDFEKSIFSQMEFESIYQSASGLARAWKIPVTEKRKEPAFSLFIKSAFFGTRLPEAEKQKNKIFILLLLGTGCLLIIFRVSGLEIPPPFGALFGVFYTACFFLYGFWILSLLSGLPFGWKFSSVLEGTLAAGLGLGALVLIDHGFKIRKTLAPGYRKCPHCGEAIVLLAVKCFVCNKDVK